MKPNISKRIDKIEKELANDKTEILVAWDEEEAAAAKEKIRLFEEANPGVPVPYQLIEVVWGEPGEEKDQ